MISDKSHSWPHAVFLNEFSQSDNDCNQEKMKKGKERKKHEFSCTKMVFDLI